MQSFDALMVYSHLKATSESGVTDNFSKIYYLLTQDSFVPQYVCLDICVCVLRYMCMCTKNMCTKSVSCASNTSTRGAPASPTPQNIPEHQERIGRGDMG